MRIEAVCVAVPGLASGDIGDWIARGWVAPAGEPPDWMFADADVARVRLVQTLRVQAGIEEDSLATVLSLLDQVHGLRRGLQALAEALAEQPAPVARAVFDAARRRLSP